MADEVEEKHKKKKKVKHKLKKRKRDPSPVQENSMSLSKLIKLGDKNVKGRQFTVSLALPGSILDNAQSPELRTYLAGQIARALAVFSIDEVVIFDESGKALSNSDNGLKRNTDPNILLARILQYLECPQYLRKIFFPKHSDLQYAGTVCMVVNKSTYSGYTSSPLTPDCQCFGKGQELGTWERCRGRSKANRRGDLEDKGSGKDAYKSGR